MIPPVPFEAWTDSHGAPGYLHGTKAALQPGDAIEPGRPSNFGERNTAAFVYLTGMLDAATWGASWPSATVRGGSTSSSRPGRSRTIRTSRTRSSPATRRAPTARARRSG